MEDELGTEEQTGENQSDELGAIPQDLIDEVNETNKKARNKHRDIESRYKHERSIGGRHREDSRYSYNTREEVMSRKPVEDQESVNSVRRMAREVIFYIF